jgi:hypothetical protein
MYPDDSTLALAQSTDPKLNVLREQLLMLAADISRSDPKSTLEEAAILTHGISAARIRELEQYELSSDYPPANICSSNSALPSTSMAPMYKHRPILKEGVTSG